jgi:hypothetical protein
MNKTFSHILACLGAGLASSSVPSSAQQYEMVAFTVEAYGSTGMCSGAALTNPNEDDDYFDNGFSAYGQVERWTDAAVDSRDFTDATRFSWGEDDVGPYGTDFSDVIFFSGHAGASCTSGVERAYLYMGDNNPSPEVCQLNVANVTTSARHVTWGGAVAGSEADIFVNFACNTTQYCVWTAGAYDGMSAGQFNMINGFHGDVAEVSGYQSDLGSYSSAAMYNDIGEAWLDWMYDPNANASGEDNCPTSIGFGENSTEITDFFSYAGWYDFHDTGARTTNKYYRLCGCDPQDGSALPSC